MAVTPDPVKNAMPRSRPLSDAERAEIADIRAGIRALEFRLIRNRTPEEDAELRRWLDAGAPDRWPVA